MNDNREKVMSAVAGANGHAGDDANDNPLMQQLRDSRRAALNLMEDAVVAREQAESAMAELRKSEERQAFLLKLADAIRWLSDPEQIKRAAARLLGEKLSANRTFYCEVRGDDWIVKGSYEQGVRSLPEGPYAAHRYGCWMMDTYRAAGRVVVRDTRNDPNFSPAERDAHAEIGVRAAIGVPLVKEGDLVAILAVQASTPREWSDHDIALVEETADRTWAAVERAGAEQALREKEAELNAIIHETPFMLTRCTSDLRYRYVSPVYAAMLKSTPDEINGRPIRDVIGEEGWKTLAPYAETVLRGERAEYEESVNFCGVGERYLHGVYTPDVDARGDVIGWFGSIVDVTERREADAALRLSEDQYRSLFTSIDEGFCTVEVLFDDDGKCYDYRILETNPAFDRQAGITNAEGKTAREILPDQEEFWFETYGRIAKTDEAFRFEHEEAALGGKVYDVYAFRTNEPTLNRVAVLFSDITDRKRREANLTFLAEVSQDLVRLTSIEDTIHELGAKIGSYLSVSRCVFYEVIEAEDKLVVIHDWHLPELQSRVGEVPISQLASEEFVQRCRAGETMAIDDVHKSSLVDSDQLESVFDTDSLVCVPVLKAAEWRFALMVHNSESRVWREDEIELLREVTARISTRFERARAEEAVQTAALKLRETTELFFGLIENAPFGVYLIDSQFRLAQVSAAAQKVFENVHPLIGRDFTEVLRAIWVEPFATTAIERFRSALETGKEYRSEETVENRADTGGIEAYDWQIKRIELPDGTFGVVCYFFDLTERRRAEKALRWTEERLRLLTESFRDFAIFTSDPQGHVVTWNPGAEKIFGFREDEIVGKNARILFVPEDQASGEAEREMETALTKGRAADERWHQRKDGSRFYASGIMAPLSEGHELVGFAKIARDLTEQKRAEEELQRQYDKLESIVAGRTAELEEANEALREQMVQRRLIEEERFALLQKIVTTQEDERRRIARDMHDSLGQQMTALRLKIASVKEAHAEDLMLGESLEQLQHLGAKVDSEVNFLVWELRPTVLDDLGLVAAIQNYAREWSRHYGIGVEVHTGRFAKERLDTDVETNLYRILQEALNNAYKHSRANGVNVMLESRYTQIVLVIEDDGVGFDPDNLKINPDTGRGLGLIGIRERAAIIGGEVEIESSPGSGTTIFVRIPLGAGA